MASLKFIPGFWLGLGGKVLGYSTINCELFLLELEKKKKQNYALQLRSLPNGVHI